MGTGNVVIIDFEFRFCVKGYAIAQSQVFVRQRCVGLRATVVDDDPPIACCGGFTVCNVVDHLCAFGVFAEVVQSDLLVDVSALAEKGSAF